MKKGLLIIGMLMLIVGSADAQQLARRSQFLFNTYLTNPAVAGTKLYSPISASFRNQWAGFDGAPKTYLLSGHTGLPNRIGVGGIFFHDDTGGSFSRTGAEFTGTYHVDLNNQDAVSFGLSGVVTQFRFDGTDLEVLDQNDQALLGNMESGLNFDANFGMMVYGPNYFFGFAIPNLLQTRLPVSGFIEDDNRNMRHFHFMGSYYYELNEEFAIQPSALARFTTATPVQMDFLIKAIYMDMVWAGVTYRHNDAVALALGFEYDRYAIGYSYDITTTDAANFSPHTHEVTVAYYLPRRGGTFSEKSLIGKRILSRQRVVK